MDEFLHLLANPAHWGFEAVTDAVFGFVGYLAARPVFQRWLKRHDKEAHGG